MMPVVVGLAWLVFLLILTKEVLLSIALALLVIAYLAHITREPKEV